METGSDSLRLSPNYDRRLAMLRNKPEFEPEQVAAAVEVLTGRPVTAAPIFLPRGLGNQNWIAHTARGRLLVKIGAGDAPVAKWRAAALALDLAARAGLPVPRPVASHERLPALDGRIIRVFELVEGYTLDDPATPGKVPRQPWTDFGAAVRRLHAVRLDAFASRIDGSAPAFATWDAYLAYRIPQTQERVRASRWLDAPTLGPFWDALQATAGRVAPVIHPTLTHRDLHVGNVLISPSGGLAAILDWDQAEAWDPVGDFFKLDWLLFQEVPGSEPAFIAGYGSPAGVHPHFDQRLHIVNALGLVGTIAGALPEEADAVRRLHARLRAVAAAAGWPSPVPSDRGSSKDAS